MRKTLFLMLLGMVCGGGAFATVGCITLRNANTHCGVNVTLYGICFSTGDGLPCSIITNNIWLAPAPSSSFPTTVNWPSVGPIATVGYMSGGISYPAPGFNTISSGSLPSALNASTDFTWTDVAFQFDCSSSGLSCPGYGGAISDVACSSTCLSSGTVWNVTCASSSINAQWTTSSSCTPGVALTIDFY